MKDLRIFVASSKELERERNELAFLVLSKEEDFAARGLRVRLAKWEYVDPKMTEGRTEDRYLAEMHDCDAVFVLFRNIAGMYTREELDKALAKEREGSTRCAWEKLSGEDWSLLLRALPQLGDHCAWEKLEGMHWSWFLVHQFQFAEHCAWEKLDAGSWQLLLLKQPQLPSRRPADKSRPEGL